MKIYRESFETAVANMAFDEMMLTQTMADGVLRFRVYPWQFPGITYPDRIVDLDEFEGQDLAPRVSGGGIVFHAAGDLVFCCVARCEDPFFEKSFKAKLAWFPGWVRAGLARLGVNVDVDFDVLGEADLRYCASYPSPYELTVFGEKVLGVAIRRYRDVFLVQGVVHLGLIPRISAEVLGEILITQLG